MYFWSKLSLLQKNIPKHFSTDCFVRYLNTRRLYITPHQLPNAIVILCNHLEDLTQKVQRDRYEKSKIFVKHEHSDQKDANLRSSNDPDFAPWQYLGRLASLYEGEVSCWQNNYIFRWPASGPCVWNFYCCFSVIFFSDGALAVKLFLTDTIIMLT